MSFLRRSGLRRAFSCLFLTIGSTPLAAQQVDTVTKKPTVLDAAIITATRVSQVVREVPANVAVLGTQDIQRSAARTVSDFLRVIPGYTTKDHQSSVVSHPSRQAPALRGLGGTSASRTLVLLDGVPMNEPFAGWVFWPRVPLALVKQAEVVRGGGAGVWGDRALGGVINLITDDPRENSLTLAATAGSFGATRTSAVGTGRRGSVGALFAAEYFDTDGYINVPTDVRGAIDTEVDSRNTALFGKVTWDPSSNVRVFAGGNYMDDDRQNGTAMRFNATTLRDLRGGVRWLAGDGSLINASAYVGSSGYENFFANETLDRSSETPSVYQFAVPAHSLGAQLQWSKDVLRSHRLTAGTDFSLVDGEVNEDFNFNQGSFAARRRVFGEQQLVGVYLQDAISLGERFRVLASARYDRWQNQNAQRTERNLRTGATTLDTAYLDRSDSRASYSLGLRHQTTRALALRGAVYRSFRSPTLNELYKPFREAGNIITESNPGLRPESLTGFDAGIDVLLGTSFVSRLTGFYSVVDDPILEVTIANAGTTGRPIAPCGFVPAGGTCRRRDNIEEFRTTGLEAEIEGRPHRFWTLGASYMWNPTEITKAPTQPLIVGKVARGTAEHQWTALVGFDHPRIAALHVTTRFVGERWDDDLNTLHVESFTVTDVRAARNLTSNANVFLTVENVFDREYSVTRAASGFVRLGGPRFIEGGIQYRWR
ncbi:MAG TPA: TonB-dependent receptor [Gemmatimonadaceae bacterium]|nr:TonB-dependent receptor [Gemmatimonadaceae bacterium]